MRLTTLLRRLLGVTQMYVKQVEMAADVFVPLRGARAAVRSPSIRSATPSPPASGAQAPTSRNIQDLYGHTSPETTIIYAPPELAKHHAAIDRLRQSDAQHPPSPLGTAVSADLGP